MTIDLTKARQELLAAWTTAMAKEKNGSVATALNKIIMSLDALEKEIADPTTQFHTPMKEEIHIEVLRLIADAHGNTVSAVKYYRSKTGTILSEAMHAVENIKSKSNKST